MDPWYWRKFNDANKMKSRKMKQKKNFQESNFCPHVSFLVNLTFISSPKNSKLNNIDTSKWYTVLIHVNKSHYNLFLRSDLRDFIFQDTTIMILCLEKDFNDSSKQNQECMTTTFTRKLDYFVPFIEKYPFKHAIV
jgi:hypothetical protein